MWFKVRALFAHSKTILAARIYSAAGVVVVVHDGVGAVLAGQDFTPISTRVMDVLHVAQDFRALVWGLFISATGVIFEWLRRVTTKSLDDKATEAQVQESAATPPVAS